MDWAGIILSTVIGIPIGILCSLAAWWILFFLIVPKIQFSPSISKIRANETKSNFKYRFAFQNSGRRSIVDAEIYARLRIEGLNPDYPKNTNIYSVPLGYDKIPKIVPHKGGSKHIIRLDITEIDELVSQTFPNKNTLSNFEENPNLLEDLLSLDRSAELQIYIFGFDEGSGTRKVFESKHYQLKDVLRGRFSISSLNIIEPKRNKI